MATRQQIENEIKRTAKRYRLNERIFRAQLNQESGLNPNVTSPAGARGVAQFIPSTAKIYGVNLNDGRVADDIDGAARYMRDNLKTFGGSYRKALAAYNAGAGAVQKYGGVPPYAETQAYVSRILSAAGVGSSPTGPSSSASRRESAPNAQQGGEPQTTTETRTAFDAAGYQTAQRRAALGQLIAQRNPNSSLLRFGLLSTTEPSRTDFTSTTQVQAQQSRTNASDSRLLTGGRDIGGTGHKAGAAAAIDYAKSRIGWEESGGENRGKLPDYLNSRFGFGRQGGQPWCAMFTSVAVTKGGAPASARTASVAQVRAKVASGQGYQRGFVDPARAKQGDLVLWGDRHIGMVESARDGKLTIIAGNDSDRVQRRTISASEVDIARPKYGKRRR